MSIPKEELRIIRDNFESCQPFFEAIGDSTRSAIVMTLIMAGEEGIRVGDIQDAVHLSRPAVSHHLKVLKESGVVNVRPEGTKNYYSLNILELRPHLQKASKDLDTFAKKYFEL